MHGGLGGGRGRGLVLVEEHIGRYGRERGRGAADMLNGGLERGMDFGEGATRSTS